MFRSSVPRRASLGSSIRLRLEYLETRDQPDGLPADPPTPPNPEVELTETTNQAPTIVDFDAEEIGNGTFVISGRVLDENPEGMVITLAGSTSASGITITVDADGYFTYVVDLRTDGTDSGYITATTVDSFGVSSAEVNASVTPTPP